MSFWRNAGWGPNSPEDIGRRAQRRGSIMNVVSVLRHLWYFWSWQYAQLLYRVIFQYYYADVDLAQRIKAWTVNVQDKALDGFGIFCLSFIFIFFSPCAAFLRRHLLRIK
ncbi:hypothetical protein EDB89DRAFT_1547947 [Lactarius sanguifluus]|nr:hypothetical protein EDB89DRAFT_1547947 [Lactarius sanguifluus]